MEGIPRSRERRIPWECRGDYAERFLSNALTLRVKYHPLHFACTCPSSSFDSCLFASRFAFLYTHMMLFGLDVYEHQR